MSGNEFIDWVTTPKGGGKSGHWGHAGRPGKRGGSAPKNGIPKVFKGREDLYNAALDYFGGGVYGRNLYDQVNNMRWRLENVKPDSYNYTTEFEVEPLKGLYPDPPYPENPKEWDTYAERRNEIAKNYTLTLDEYAALIPELEKRLVTRLENLRKESGIPATLAEIIPGDLIAPEYSGNMPPDKKARLDELYQTSRNFAKTTIANMDLNEDSLGDVTGALTDHLYQALDAKYGPRDWTGKKYPPEYEAQKMWIDRLTDDLKEEANFQASTKYYSGEWNAHQAARNGYSIEGKEYDRDLAPLPKDLWHVTTNAGLIKKTGIQSRYELGIWNGPGLGGGSDKTISFSTDPDIGTTIERSLHEGHLVAKGEITAGMLLQSAEKGLGGVGRPWLREAVRRQESSYEVPPDFTMQNRKGMSLEVENLLDWEAGKEVTTYRGEKWTKDDYQETLWRFYAISYMGIREQAGGFSNPLFFGTDYKKLAKMNPKEFKVLRYRPATTKARGWQMGSLAEWRVVGKDSVKLVGVIDKFDPDSPDFMEQILGGRL